MPAASVAKPQPTHVLEFAERFATFFDALGSQAFAAEMATYPIFEEDLGRELVLEKLPEAEIVAATGFHGDIGQARATLDGHGRNEQGGAFKASTEAEAEELRAALLREGAAYKQRHGIKFMVSAAGKSAREMLEMLRARMNNPTADETKTARAVLWEIALKRLRLSPLAATGSFLEDLHHRPKACAVAVCNGTGISTRVAGAANPSTYFEMASLSKMVGTAFAMEFFASKGIPLTTKVNDLLASIGDEYRVPVAEGCPEEWASKLTIEHLLSHLGLNMHYVHGVPANLSMAPMADYLRGFEHNPVRVEIINEPGTKFKYSGAGFIVLQYIIEKMQKQPIAEVTRGFLDACGAHDLTMAVEHLPGVEYALGYDDDGNTVEGGRKMFPSFAAGGSGTPAAMLSFLRTLNAAYHELEGAGPISHDTARRMLYGVDRDLTFMGCKMGVGVFVLEGGANKFMLHQGANDGFRVLNLVCFDGPDAGKGFVTVSTGDVDGVFVNAEIAQKLIRLLGIGQCDTSRFHSDFNRKGLKQEDVVNKGYRELVFRAFANQRPEEIVVKGPKDPLASSNLLRKGTGVRYVSNERFARVENLFSDHLPHWDPELFGSMGKIMDSWETERHNARGVDEAIISVPPGSQCRYLFLSNMYHNGNHAPEVAIQIETEIHTPTNPSSPYSPAPLRSEKPAGFAPVSTWGELLPRMPMAPHSYRCIDLGELSAKFSAVKIQLFPDGGFSRLGVYADVPEEFKGRFVPLRESVPVPHSEPIQATKKPLSIPYEPTKETIAENLARVPAGALYDCASQAFGGSFVSASNEHYGKASNTINPFAPLSMFDGLESARSRRPNSFEQMVIRLNRPAQLRRIVVDFTYFVNNSPVDLEISGRVAEGDANDDGSADEEKWVAVVPRRFVKCYSAGKMLVELPSDSPVVHLLRIKCFPCGGFNRIHAFAVKE